LSPIVSVTQTLSCQLTSALCPAHFLAAQHITKSESHATHALSYDAAVPVRVRRLTDRPHGGAWTGEPHDGNGRNGRVGSAGRTRQNVSSLPPPAGADEDRFLAVIAHEIGHEEHRHVLRSVLQNSGVVLISVYFTGDVSSASALVVSVPTFLLNSHYSRAFEAEADDYAFASLAAHHISPGRFAEVMEAMQKADPHIRHEVGYLSTHPLSVDRIMSARKAAERFR